MSIVHIDAFELWYWRRLEIPLDCKEIKPVNPKGNQSWVFIGRTDAEAKTPILWPPDVKCWLIGKDPDAGKDWRWEEKGTAEDEMVGWHHWFNGCEFEQAPGVGDGQGSLVCCRPWGSQNQTRLRNWTTTSFGNLLSVYMFWRNVSDFLHCSLSEVQLLGISAAVWTFAGAPGVVLPGASLGGSFPRKFHQEVVLSAALFLCSPWMLIKDSVYIACMLLLSPQTV